MAVKLYVSMDGENLPCGTFKDESASMKWFIMNRESFRDSKRRFGVPITVRPK